jgi:hypothetical protein
MISFEFMEKKILLLETITPDAQKIEKPKK